jgi:hypothetical protein
MFAVAAVAGALDLGAKGFIVVTIRADDLDAALRPCGASSSSTGEYRASSSESGLAMTPGLLGRQAVG